MASPTHILVLTWNVGNKVADETQVPHPEQLTNWFSKRALGDGKQEHPVDLVIIGLQELHPNLLPLYKTLFLKALEGGQLEFTCALAAHVETYYPLLVFVGSASTMVDEAVADEGFRLVQPPCALRYAPVDDPILKTELNSKGAVCAGFELRGQDIVVANCHWQHAYTGQTQRIEMQSALQEMVFGGDEVAPPGFFFLQLGDLNFRVVASREVSREPTKKDREGCANFQAEFEEVVGICEAGKGPELLFPARDQLSQARLGNETVFRGFEEMPIGFKPTYKRAQDNLFDRSEPRLPGWCDRILWRGSCSEGGASAGGRRMIGLEYTAIEEVTYTDHRPVCLRAMLQATLSGEGANRALSSGGPCSSLR
mmetsp:Transcript_83287/g.193468  ORF Transcript_83287/g.193468 Transcript_83287/m.193468 type:complete len:368 (-) Transcript_83287:96-1199(-)